VEADDRRRPAAALQRDPLPPVQRARGAQPLPRPHLDHRDELAALPLLRRFDVALPLAHRRRDQRQGVHGALPEPDHARHRPLPAAQRGHQPRQQPDDDAHQQLLGQGQSPRPRRGQLLQDQVPRGGRSDAAARDVQERRARHLRRRPGQVLGQGVPARGDRAARQRLDPAQEDFHAEPQRRQRLRLQHARDPLQRHPRAPGLRLPAQPRQADRQAVLQRVPADPQLPSGQRLREPRQREDHLPAGARPAAAGRGRLGRARRRGLPRQRRRRAADARADDRREPDHRAHLHRDPGRLPPGGHRPQAQDHHRRHPVPDGDGAQVQDPLPELGRPVLPQSGVGLQVEHRRRAEHDQPRRLQERGRRQPLRALQRGLRPGDARQADPRDRPPPDGELPVRPRLVRALHPPRLLEQVRHARVGPVAHRRLARAGQLLVVRPGHAAPLAPTGRTNGDAP